MQWFQQPNRSWFAEEGNRKYYVSLAYIPIIRMTKWIVEIVTDGKLKRIPQWYETWDQAMQDLENY